MKKLVIGVILSMSLSYNFSFALVPTTDKLQISNSMKQLMEEILKHKEQVDTWNQEALRYINETTGINASNVLDSMGVKQDSLLDLFSNNFAEVFGNLKPEQVFENIAIQGLSGFPDQFKNKALENYKKVAKPTSNRDIAQNKVAEYCGARDAAILMMTANEESSLKYRNKKINNLRGAVSDNITGPDPNARTSDDEKGGTTSVAAGTTATAIVADSNAATADLMINGNREQIENNINKYNILCKEAYAEYSKTDAAVGFSTVIDVLSIGFGRQHQDSFTPKDPRFK